MHRTTHSATMPLFDDDADLYKLAKERSSELRFRAHPDPCDPEYPEDDEGSE